MNGVDLPQLATLAAVIDEGSFEGAAFLLGVSQPAVSQRIKSLENNAGQILLVRSRPVVATEAGTRYLRLARQIGSLLSDVTDEDDRRSLATVVPIAVNDDSLTSWVMPALASVGSGILFDLRSEDQDFSADLLRDGSVMAAITAAEAPVQGCTSTRLGAMKYRAMAARPFAARWFPGGSTPVRLSRAPVVVFDRRDDLQHAYLRERLGDAAAPPCHYVPSSTAYTAAIRHGMGWGMLPEHQAVEGERSGQLVDIDPGHRTHVTLFWQQWALKTSALDRTAEAIKAAAAQSLS